MKTTIRNLLLFFGIILLSSVIVLSFFAERQFEKAEELEASYRWKKAGAAYQQAVHLNPFSGEYFAGAGSFMLRQAEVRKGKDKISWLKRAEKLYERACVLNPQYAENWYWLGKTKLDISRQDELSSKHYAVGSVVENFREAVEKDPYNFPNSYLVGYDLFTVWDNLDNAEKSFALGRFKYVLQRNPWYGDSVYPAVIYYAKDFSLAEEVTPRNPTGCKRLYSFIVRNNLWQYRKQVKDSLDFYRQKEEPEEFEREKKERMRLLRSLTIGQGWVGKSESGKDAYKNGHMYWEGTVNRAVKLAGGKAVIHIQARGDAAYDVWPYMIVELDGEEIGEGFVDSSEWKGYSFGVDTEGGIKVLSVTFPNDDGDWEKGIDRNLYVGEVKVE